MTSTSPCSTSAVAPSSTGNGYWDKLLSEASHLREVNERLVTGLIRRFDDLDAAARREVVATMDANRIRAERLERQVAWYRYQAGEPVAVVPDGPEWRD